MRQRAQNAGSPTSMRSTLQPAVSIGSRYAAMPSCGTWRRIKAVFMSDKNRQVPVTIKAPDHRPSRLQKSSADPTGDRSASPPDNAPSEYNPPEYTNCHEGCGNRGNARLVCDNTRETGLFDIAQFLFTTIRSLAIGDAVQAERVKSRGRTRMGRRRTFRPDVNISMHSIEMCQARKNHHCQSLT